MSLRTLDEVTAHLDSALRKSGAIGAVKTEADLVKTLQGIMNWYPKRENPSRALWDKYLTAKRVLGTKQIAAFVKKRPISNLSVIVLGATPEDESNVADLCLAFYGMEAWRAAGLRSSQLTDDTLRKIIAKGPDWIKFFHETGGKFRVCQDADGQTLLMLASRRKHNPEAGEVEYQGDENLRAYLSAGGPVTDLKDKYGYTECHHVTSGAVRALADYLKAGGKITDARTVDGYTAAISPLASDGNSVRAYIQGGGKFFPHILDKSGRSEALIAMMHPNGLETYMEEGQAAGAKFTGISEFHAVGWGARAVHLFHKYGGVFTNAVNADGKTSGDVACAFETLPEIAQAYEECVRLQGGLKNIMPGASGPALRP